GGDGEDAVAVAGGDRVVQRVAGIGVAGDHRTDGGAVAAVLVDGEALVGNGRRAVGAFGVVDVDAEEQIVAFAAGEAGDDVDRHLAAAGVTGGIGGAGGFTHPVAEVAVGDEIGGPGD